MVQEQLSGHAIVEACPPDPFGRGHVDSAGLGMMRDRIQMGPMPFQQIGIPLHGRDENSLHQLDDAERDQKLNCSM